MDYHTVRSQPKPNAFFCFFFARAANCTTVRAFSGAPGPNMLDSTKATTLLLCAGLLLGPSLAAAPAQSQGPCDIYEAAGTPCAAAHSTARALFSGYGGALYEVTRHSDRATLAIGTTASGAADAAAQDSFCRGTGCVVTALLDQTPHQNHLHTAPGGPIYNPVPDHGVNASRAEAAVHAGSRVYGAYFEGKMGYRNDSTSGVPVGEEAETMYMLVDGRHFNDKCCFDYGNAETDDHDDGVGTMEALYFGNANGLLDHPGGGRGPWVMADLENGVWAGNESAGNAANTAIDADFVLALLKRKPGAFGLKGADASTAGTLRTLYEGPPPAKYKVMKKQGALILGIGGDNSNSAVGTFYEGVVVRGFTSDAADEAVHANLVAAGYSRRYA